MCGTATICRALRWICVAVGFVDSPTVVLARRAQSGAMTEEPATVFLARRVITMDPVIPGATAVAVAGRRIVAVGDAEDLVDAGTVDDTFADAVICAGLIDQHLHPILGATTLNTEVIANEDWVLPGKTFPAAHPIQQRIRHGYRRQQPPAPEPHGEEPPPIAARSRWSRCRACADRRSVGLWRHFTCRSPRGLRSLESVPTKDSQL